ncbi:hypothetical protein CWE15_04435 [Aliidiomarina taiwanensis]|uniref:Uncharacterized protein n=1 Tax=Aliidiomarina taiwanensis TaxID=946228 RepID=A0A432X769_9GAMM|nr:hypothetical protein [Aliidiomarina taiwanensis]RUO42666.1 hypothetical protein CWE15_04435 [Aliidiomarina taiwanensis]
MEWPVLLASTARLLDLHDSDRTAGGGIYSPDERRRGAGTGIWLDVGTRLLQYLYERDLESNEAWIPLEGIISELIQLHDVTREDIIFVANHLATPTRLITLRDSENGALQRQIYKRETALLEWPKNTNRRDRCRLSASGTRAVLLSQAAQNWLYAANDAGKLERAIDYGAYADVPQLAEGLISQIRRFSKEITLLLERQHLEDLLSDFAEHRDDYMKVITEVQNSVEVASELFNTKQVKEQYSRWLETEGGISFTPYTITQSFTEILQAIERLSRKFQKLVSVLASSKREVIGLVRFDLAAVGLAFHPCSESITELCIAALGPWATEITAPSPLDFSGVLSLQQEEDSKTILVFDDEAVDELPSLIERFLSSYREEILSQLRIGPVPLSLAVEKGWLTVEDFDALPQLIGVYASPEWLDDTNSELAVTVAANALDVQLPDGSHLEGDDLILHWLRSHS